MGIGTESKEIVSGQPTIRNIGIICLGFIIEYKFGLTVEN